MEKSESLNGGQVAATNGALPASRAAAAWFTHARRFWTGYQAISDWLDML